MVEITFQSTASFACSVSLSRAFSFVKHRITFTSVLHYSVFACACHYRATSVCVDTMQRAAHRKEMVLQAVLGQTGAGHSWQREATT